MKKPSAGFTLIELLVVIALIGILASVILVSLNSARSKARDAQRVSNLQQLQTSLEMYYNNSGHYPIASQTADCWLPNQNWIPDNGNYNWSADIIASQPQDPIDNCCWPSGNCGSAGQAGTYEYWSDGNRYLLVARLENTSNPVINGTRAIDPRNGLPFAQSEAGTGPLGKYCFVIAN